MRLIPRVRSRKDDDEGSMTLVQHLEELRGRLTKMLIAITVGGAAGWFLYGPVVELLIDPYCDYIQTLPAKSRPPQGCQLIFLGAMDGLLLKLKVVLFLGLALALPYVLYQLWSFIVPGLTRRERRLAVPFVISASLLFLLGCLFAYVTLPKALQFLLGFAGSDLVPLLTGDKFIGFLIIVSLAFGLSFEFPIVLIFLAMAGVVSSRKLRDWRRPAILFIAIFSAVITPSADPYTMFAMMIPMYIFYEAAILVARLMKK
jgi:sec-independent protein translocase protein TatC